MDSSPILVRTGLYYDNDIGDGMDGYISFCWSWTGWRGWLT